MEYSTDTWKCYLPLFNRNLPKLIDRLERLTILYSDVLPISVKAEVITFSRVMFSEKNQYMQIPHLQREMLLGKGPLKEKDIRSIFRVRFTDLMGMIKLTKTPVEEACKETSMQLESCRPSPTQA